jgi:hypothetical protein
MARRTLLRAGLAGLGTLLLAGAVGAWRALRVEDIPEELPPIAAQLLPEDLVLPGAAGRKDLVLRELRGKTVALVVEGQASMRSREGRALNRALGRWVLPDSTFGAMIGDATGFALFKSKIDEMVQWFEPELRFPIWVDYTGVVFDTFSLPRGHAGLVVLAPDGAVALRHSGPADDATIEQVRRLLGASEPPPGPPAPEFRLGTVDRSACLGRGCVIGLFGAPASAAALPGPASDGEEAERKGREAMSRPELRLLAALQRLPLPEGMLGVLVGEVEGFRDDEGRWQRLAEAQEARAAFEIPAGETALVVVDREGRVALREAGRFPMYRMGRLAEVLGVELREEDEDG